MEMHVVAVRGWIVSILTIAALTLYLKKTIMCLEQSMKHNIYQICVVKSNIMKRYSRRPARAKLRAAVVNNNDETIFLAWQSWGFYRERKLDPANKSTVFIQELLLVDSHYLMK